MVGTLALEVKGVPGFDVLHPEPVEQPSQFLFIV
jgi:hypothetical protein